MKDKSQQRHDQDEDDRAADDCVRDAGVVAQAVVQSYKVLPWSLCCGEAELLVAVVLTVVLAIAQKTAVHTASVSALETGLCAHKRVPCAVLLVTAVRTVTEAVTAEPPDDAVSARGASEERGGTFGLDLGTTLFIALVEAVGQPIALPAPRDTLAIATHEVPRDVALCGEVAPREQLGFHASRARTKQKIPNPHRSSSRSPPAWLVCLHPALGEKLWRSRKKKTYPIQLRVPSSLQKCGLFVFKFQEFRQEKVG